MNARVFIPVDKAAFYRFIATEPEGRYEFERGRIVQQMTGGTQNHFRIAQRIILALLAQLDAAKWAALQDWGVDTPKTVRFGDVVVYPAGQPGNSVSTERPAMVVEILSPSSIKRDLDIKPAEYLALPTLEAYIVASQTEAACLAWVRGADGTFPVEPVEYAGDDMIAVARLGVALSIAEIYRGIPLTIEDSPPHG